MPMFGGMPSGLFNMPQVSGGGGNSPPPQPRLRFMDKLGLAGDLLTGSPFTQHRLEPDFIEAQQQRQFQMRQMQPQNVGGNIVQFDPATGGYRTLYSAPQEAPQPNALERNFQFLEQQQPGLGRSYAQNFANNGGGAPQIMNVPGVGVVAVPRSGGGGNTPPPPPGAIDLLRKNPSFAPQFDQKYGPGASQQYLQGGAMPSASGGFR